MSGSVSWTKSESVWFIEKSSCSATFTRTFAPSTVRGINSMIFLSTNARKSCQARRFSAFFAFGNSCELLISDCMAAQPSLARVSTFSSVPCVI